MLAIFCWIINVPHCVTVRVDTLQTFTVQCYAAYKLTVAVFM